MRIIVPRERASGEARVAASPETVARMVADGHEVRIEPGGGAAAHFSDEAYLHAGAQPMRDRAQAWASADVVFKVGPPAPDEGLPSGHEASAVREEALWLGFVAPWRQHDAVRRLRDRRVSTLAVDLIPRTTRAQPMDALSSQASIAGYKAVLLAAARLDRGFPLMMTAAGTLHPARVVVLGAGVAGLSALATARRLGATVEVSDVREEVAEQVASLGGRFVELPMREGGTGEGGYAREMSETFLREQRALVAERIAVADVVITTALVPGRPAPRLIDEATVKRMRPGSVVVDLAVESGGNCALSIAGETVERHGVVVLGPPNLPATVPMDASTVYARNLLALFIHAVHEGAPLDLEDEIVSAALLTHAGEVRHAPTRAAIEGGQA